MPEDNQNEEFVKELSEQIKSWIFPDNEGGGSCQVVLEYQVFPPEPDWHMYEMMMNPDLPEIKQPVKSDNAYIE